MDTFRFIPSYNSGQTLTANATSQSTLIEKGTPNIRITNTGSNVAYIRIGYSAVTVTATTADYIILPLHSEVITKNIDPDTLAYISATGTTLHVQEGEGL